MDRILLQTRSRKHPKKGETMTTEKSILVIDDEVELGEIMVDILSPHFNQVTYQASADLALEQIKRIDYDLILTDVNMPKLQGPELIRYTRAAGKLTPVIFVTAYADKEMVLKALRLGASDVIEKPFNPEEIIKSMDRTFEIERRRAQLILNQHHSEENGNSNLNKQEKMLGLLMVAGDKKK